MHPIHYWGRYPFQVIQPPADWANIPGIYVFAVKAGTNALGQQMWRAVYVGQASNFADRLPSHERWDEARRKFATHIHAMFVPNPDERDRVERELICSLQPTLNAMLKKPEQMAVKYGAGLLGTSVMASGLPMKGLLHSAKQAVPALPNPAALGLPAGLLSRQR